jgi:predicted dehydrogenase
VEQFQADGVEVFADAVEMFGKLSGKIDAVFVPTGIHTHCELACAAMRCGHHVYLEKPPAATVQEVDRMLAAAAETGRMCALGFQMIFSRSMEELKQRVVAGALGAVRRVRTWAHWFRTDAYYARNEWAGRMKLGDAWVLDGPSNNALSHEIANLLCLASPRPRAFAIPKTVRAELYHARDISGEDTSSIHIRTVEGPELWFTVSHCTAGEHTGPWIEMDCSEAVAHWDRTGAVTIEHADGRTESLPADDGARTRALANFTEAVRAGDASLLKCDLTMGRNFTLALNGAWESSGGSHPIDPKYVRREGKGGDGRTVVEGLREAIDRCAAEAELFSDAGCPWAVRTEPFDLTGYRGFPQRLQA